MARTMRIVLIVSFMVYYNACYDAFAFIQQPPSNLKKMKTIEIPSPTSTRRTTTTTTTTTCIILNAASSKRNRQPPPEDMSGLFPGEGPYVPSGMSAEEYQNLKRKESEAQSKMNFGAWGPRFKQSQVPDGDWMVMPNLWTSGTVTNRPGGGGLTSNTATGNTPIDNKNKNNVKNIIRRLLRQPQYIFTFLKQNSPGLLLTYIMIDLLISAITMYTVLAVSAITPQPKINPVINKELIFSILKYSIFKHKNLLVLTWIQTLVAKFSLSIIFVPFSNAFLEQMNRRRLWTKRRTILTTTFAGFLALSAWAVGCTWIFDTLIVASR